MRLITAPREEIFKGGAEIFVRKCYICISKVVNCWLIFSFSSSF